MTSRKLFALTLYLLLFAGCSGSDAVPEKEAINQDESTATAQQADRSPENVATQPEQPTDQPSVEQPQESGMTQANSEPEGGELAQWLSPYLSDDLATVMAIDLRRLGPAEKALPLIHQLIGRGQEVDLSDVNQVALVYDLTMMRFAWLLRTAQPASKLQERIRTDFDIGSGEYDFFATFADDNTVAFGSTRLVDQLKRKHRDPELAAMLNSQGDRTAILYFHAIDDVRERIRSIAEQLGDDQTDASIDQAVQLVRSIIIAADLDRQSSLKVTLQPWHADQNADLKQLMERTSRSAQDRLRIIRAWASEDSREWLLSSMLVSVLKQGRWESTNEAVHFHWKAPPEFSDRVPEVITQIKVAVAEAKSAVMLGNRRSQLKQIATGLLLHADRNEEHFPHNIVSADGKPLMSWRVELLPVMEHQSIYSQLRRDEPWDSPHNAALLKQVDPRLFASNPDTPDGYADIQAVIGPDFGFSPADKDHPNGVSIAQVTDGMTYSVMAVEVAPEKAVPWAKPDDYVWDTGKPTEGLGAKDEPYFLAVFGDASSKAISKQESADTLKAAFGRGDGTPYYLAPVRTQ